MEDLVDAAVMIVILLALIGSWAWSVAWFIRDTKGRGKLRLALPLVAIFGVLGVLVWLIIRPERIAEKQCSDYENADDAFLAASQLDTQGDWDKAIALYQYGADRWPEHRTYAENSIEAIRAKQPIPEISSLD